MSPSSAGGHGPFARVTSRSREVIEPILGDGADILTPPGGSEEAELHLSRMRRRLGLATLLLVLFLTFMDNTVISVTLANVQSTLHTGISQLQWVINGYALVFASFMLLFGTLGDQLGRKKVMLSGVILFCCGSVVAAVAQNADTLIAGRVIMGLGAAASEPSTLSMIRHLYPERRARAKALGIWAAVSGLALAMGPLIGGVLVGLYSFRAVFWFNLFFGLVALVGAAAILPESANKIRYRLDFAGFLLGAGSLAAASFAIIQGETTGYRNTRIDILFAAAFALAVFFGPVRLLLPGAFAAEFFLFANTGPLNTAIVNSVSAPVRATAISINLFCIHFFGDTFSPQIIGAISDRSNLAIGLGATLISMLISCCLLWYGARFASPFEDL